MGLLFIRRVRKQHFLRFTQQKLAVFLGHRPDVIPQQGDPLELAQVFAAVHPELQGRKGSSNEYGTLQP